MVRRIGPLLAALIPLSTIAVQASDLPRSYLGSWTNDDGASQFEVSGISVGPQTYHEPGYNCDIKAVAAKNEAGSPDRGRVYVVDMVCTGEGQDPGPGQKVREVWALRKIKGVEVLVTAGTTGSTYPSIRILQRAE